MLAHTFRAVSSCYSYSSYAHEVSCHRF